MGYVDFISELHNSTKRDYLERVVKHDKAKCAEVACQFGRDYWDGDRSVGYGGMKYDGRWRGVAEKISKQYGLTANSKVLDVGCGKGFLLYEFTQVVPGISVSGIDISEYAIQNSKDEVKKFLHHGSASELPFGDNSFDLVISLNTLHNLYIADLWSAVREIQRVSKRFSYLVVEAYRNEQEKVNLMYWQLTCRAFHTPEEWAWIYEQCGYTGDYSFIYFL